MKNLIAKLSQYGILASPDALQLLFEQNEPMMVIEEVIKIRGEVLFLEEDIILDIILGMKEENKNSIEVGETAGDNIAELEISAKAITPENEVLENEETISKDEETTSKHKENSLFHETKTFHRAAVSRYRPIAAEIEEDIVVEGDITNLSRCEGKISDFSKYFHDRLTRLREIIKKRPEMMHARPVQKTRSGNMVTIGIVTEVNSRDKGLGITIEDEEDFIKIFISKSRNSRLYNSIGTVVHDEVIGVSGNLSMGKGGREPTLYPDTIIRPPLPFHHTPNLADEEISAAFVSDLHIGSKTFLGDEWKKALEFLGGKNHELRDVASTIKYLVFPGDVVDGIGIYPGQEEDLDITDIFLQYEAVAEDINSLPDHINVILMPGNHDSVRRSEPQPAFPKEIQKLFDRDRVMFVGNPIWLGLHGVNFQVYHGGGFDDLITSIPGLTYTNPISGMKEMLKRRHLAPIYGGKTPIAPEHRDYLLMDRIPDVFVTGHVHTTQLDYYHNVMLLNASTWMDQTDYQKMRDFMPDPAKLPVIRLDTLKPSIINFRG